MNKLLLTGIFFFCLNVFSQSGVLKIPCEERSFSNQGEQEDCWAEKFFEKEYLENNFQRFSGKISILNESTVKFENKTLFFWNSDPQLVDIFKKGIFYPQLLIGDGKAENIIVGDSLTSSERTFANLLQPSDTLTISGFEELKFLSNSPQNKRFRFWLFWRGRANPQVYFVELKNSEAKLDTSINDFIIGARMTFLKGAWINN